jgi:prevent-host-death family protein
VAATNRTTITATELARNLSDILNRARYRGERFVIERNGEPVATIGPPETIGITPEELARQLGPLRFPDEDFADDLEAIHASQGYARIPEWPD